MEPILAFGSNDGSTHAKPTIFPTIPPAKMVIFHCESVFQKMCIFARWKILKDFQEYCWFSAFCKSCNSRSAKPPAPSVVTTVGIIGDSIGLTLRLELSSLMASAESCPWPCCKGHMLLCSNLYLSIWTSRCSSACVKMRGKDKYNFQYNRLFSELFVLLRAKHVWISSVHRLFHAPIC